MGIIFITIGIGLIFIFIFIIPPSFLVDWINNLWRIDVLLLGIGSVFLGYIVLRYNEKYSLYHEIPRYFIFIGWRLMGIILIFTGIGLIMFLGALLYSFWVTETTTTILFFTPILGIILGAIMTLLGALCIIGGKKGLSWLKSFYNKIKS